MAKTLDELINAKEPGWAVVREWLDRANKPVEVLDVPMVELLGMNLELADAT
ncbi:DUF2625 family protein [Myxococcus sp. RHSTA-1-4]|uniref:DUF2625 family protein n=1 Tax=Myxococcus sp. RHSTA-1-4 TaxID=2874601 RepID=UPI001CBBA8B9|nr:DUF2625 family protein [Myxococcus sp. RHSTA-1-4]MBZ4415427.1 DUF2625 domain-containing protein [Myxococcus sp. RHSTA-1-4]